MSDTPNQPDHTPRSDAPDPQRFERVRDAFAEIIELPPSTRHQRLRQLAEDAPPLHASVAELMELSDAADKAGFLDHAAPPADHECALADTVPQRIGQYSIIRSIGEGGTSVVYLAASVSPMSRKAAIKVLRTNSTARSTARAAIEAEALATLNHHGIAQIYDTGLLHDGRRWIACEWVEGQPIDKACRPLNQKQIVELLARIAEAIHHAHQSGIVHRDLKPSNVLVTDRLEPKIIDFGVARVGIAESHKSAVTEPGLLVGTLAYMSPEQLEGGPIDARTDVYGLGLIACETLTGTKLPDRSASLAHLARATQVALKPRIAGSHGSERDLEAIIAKATQPDPSKRYPSMQHMADDLRRVLQSRPVHACKPSAAHRVRLYSRRHPLLSCAIGLSTLAISLLLTLLVESQHRLAEQVDDQKQLVNALVTQSLASLREIRGTYQSRLAMITALADRVERHAMENPEDPQLQSLLAKVLRDRGDMASEVGDHDKALQDLSRSLDLYATLHIANPDDIETGRLYAEAMVRIGDVRYAKDYSEVTVPVMTTYRQAMAVQQTLLERHPDHIGLLDDFSWSYDRIGELGTRWGMITPRDELESFLRDRITMCERLLHRNPGRAHSRFTLGTGHLRLANFYLHQNKPGLAYDEVKSGLPHLSAAVQAQPDRWMFVQMLLMLYATNNAALAELQRHDELVQAIDLHVQTARAHARVMPGNTHAQQALASALYYAAKMLADIERTASAHSYAEQAIIQFNKLRPIVSETAWSDMTTKLETLNMLITDTDQTGQTTHP